MVTGSYYKGNWENNLPNGYGTYVIDHGTRYEGYFKDGKRHGNGRIIMKDVSE